MTASRLDPNPWLPPHQLEVHHIRLPVAVCYTGSQRRLMRWGRPRSERWRARLRSTDGTQRVERNMYKNCEDKGLNRRGLFIAGAGLLAAAPMGALAQTPPQAAAATPDAALSLLTEGNARYVANQPRQRDFSAARASTALGQAPFAAILGCADLRVAPELAFDQNPATRSWSVSPAIS